MSKRAASWVGMGSTSLFFFVLTSGCGPGDVEPAQFQGDAVTIACERAIECCDASELAAEFARFGAPPTTVEECSAILRQRYTGEGIPGSVQAGRVGYDQSAATACLESIRATTCDEYRGGIVEIASVSGACRDALTPLLAEGDLCTQDYECITGRCETGGIGDGVCVPVPSAGEPCEFRCADGLYCAASDDGSTCAALQDDGASCAGGYECASSRCDGADPRSGTRGTCAPLAGYCDGPETAT